MNNIVWIFSGITFCLTAAYIVALILDIQNLKSFTSYYIAPMAGGIFLGLLFNFRPDTYHSLYLTTVALILLLISTIFFSFSTLKPGLKIPAGFFFFFNICVWIELFRTILYLKKVNQIFLNLMIIIYISIYIIFFIIQKDFKISVLIKKLPLYTAICILHFLALLSLIKDAGLYSALLTGGTSLLLIIYSIKYLLNNKIRLSNRTLSLFEVLFNTAAQCLIAAAAYTMVY